MIFAVFTVVIFAFCGSFRLGLLGFGLGWIVGVCLGLRLSGWGRWLCLEGAALKLPPIGGLSPRRVNPLNLAAHDFWGEAVVG